MSKGKRAWALLADVELLGRHAKTAHGVIRYSEDRIACVIDRDHAGSSLAQLMPELGRDAPIVGSLEEALQTQPTSLLIGVAPAGGGLPSGWRQWIEEALVQGLEVVSGLHYFLTEDPHLRELAASHGARLWDVRKPPSDIPLFTGKVLEDARKIVLTVGSDCAVGKMTTALELTQEARRQGVRAAFVPTGQTGILIAGWGICVDRVIADFLSGAAEKLVLEADPEAEVLIVEGQGSLWHPAYAGVTLGLLHGSAPHALVLCHHSGRERIEEPPYTPLPPLKEMIQTYEEMAATLRRAPVKGVQVAGARPEEMEKISAATGLPAGDVLQGFAPFLWEQLAQELGLGR